ERCGQIKIRAAGGVAALNGDAGFGHRAVVVGIQRAAEIEGAVNLELGQDVVGHAGVKIAAVGAVQRAGAYTARHPARSVLLAAEASVTNTRRAKLERPR